MATGPDPADLVYLVRHGKAEDHHPLGDGARALTAEGRREFRELAEELGGKPGLGLHTIATSPLVRAVQTAEILARACRVDDVPSRAELHADQATGQTVAALARQLGAGSALVGHNPSLAEALQLLLGLPETPSFRKGAVAALLPTGQKWTLLWVVSPGKKMKSEL
jgi:phosphohistidine phosphatase